MVAIRILGPAMLNSRGFSSNLGKRGVYGRCGLSIVPPARGGRPSAVNSGEWVPAGASPLPLAPLPSKQKTPGSSSDKLRCPCVPDIMLSIKISE